jgi:hypothetical protein
LLAFSHVFPKNMAAIGLATMLGTAAFGIVFERNKWVARELIYKMLQPLPIWPTAQVVAVPRQAATERNFLARHRDF